jgi:autophagy-related protein 17
MSEILSGLPVIQSEQLLNAKEVAQQQLDAQRGTLDDLDELGEIMTEMLQRQESVEVHLSLHLSDSPHCNCTFRQTLRST